MKKVILLIALVFSSFAIQAQDMMDKAPVSIAFELNGGFLQHDAFADGSRFSLIGNENGHFTNQTNKDLIIGTGSFGFEMDLFAKNKFNFGPSAKLYAHETGYFGGASEDLNHYHGSIGLVAGVDLGKFFINTSFESPTPDKRHKIYELIVSPSAGFMISDKVGIKANFDYFINKKLFNYAYSYGAGVIYKF